MATTRDWLLDDSPSSRLQARLGRSYRLSRALMRNPLAVVGAIIVLALILVALFAPWIATHSPVGQNLDMRLAPPSTDNWMGTDELGRDIWSRGMGQRIMIAMMLIPEPDLLIADEPTSALDVSVQAQVLEIIDDLVNRKGMGLILISHDLELVSAYCDRILVMRAGEVVEECAAGELRNAKHPDTRGLLASIPRLDEDREELPVLQRDEAST